MPREKARALPWLTPTRSAPTRPGALVTATASRSSRLVPASSIARSTTGTMLVRCARDAISGTTPPKTRWISCERITRDFWETSSPSPSRTAADVSSHEVSIPRMRVTCASALSRLHQKSIHERTRFSGIPVGGRHQLLSDHAVLPNDERLRVTGDIVRIRDSGLRVVQHLEGKPILLHERADGGVGAGIVDADRYDLESLRRVRLVKRFNARHLDTARQAPGWPDVDHEHFAAIVGESLFSRNRIQRECLEVGGFAAQLDWEELLPEISRGSVRDCAHNAEHDETDRQLLPSGHTCAVQRARSSAISAFGFFAAKIALPATNVSAPASHTDLIVLRSIPPSTSRNALLPFSASISRARRTLSTEPFINFCPPKPGFTVMTSSRSRSGITSLTAVRGVDGFPTAPARQPSSRMRLSCRCRCGETSV